MTIRIPNVISASNMLYSVISVLIFTLLLFLFIIVSALATCIENETNVYHKDEGGPCFEECHTVLSIRGGDPLHILRRWVRRLMDPSAPIFRVWFWAFLAFFSRIGAAAAIASATEPV